MDITGGTRATICVTAALGLAGLAITSRGILRDNLPSTVGGSCLIFSTVVVGALLLIRKWVSDTTLIRTALTATQREAERERSRYVAAQAALENEQGRLNQDMAEERRRIAASLIAEREAMRTEFEERRATLISETMEATFLMIQNGKFASDTTASGRLIQFPKQSQPQPATDRMRSREHGVVGP